MTARHGSITAYVGNTRQNPCRCDLCRAAWRDYTRHQRGYQPSMLAREVERLNAELDAAELNLEALREENAMLRCRLQELEPQ